MEQFHIEVLLSPDNDLVKSKEVLQHFLAQHPESSDFTATYEQWNVIWNAIFKILQMPCKENEECIKTLNIYPDCLAAIQVMSRDKRHLNQMITVDQFDTLLNIANIRGHDENNTIVADPVIIVGALKCLCNLVYENPTCQRMCSNICDISGIVRRLPTQMSTTCKDANNVFSYDSQYFDIKFLFLITALNPDIRIKVRDHGLTYLVEILDSIIKALSDSQNGYQELNDSQVNLLVEVMKILFIITKNRNETVSVATGEKLREEEMNQFRRLADAMHTLLLCRAISKEKQIELRSNIMNLLSNVPTACYSDLTIPMHVHVDSLIAGIDWSQEISLLRFEIEKLMNTIADEATVSTSVSMEMLTLQSTISENIDNPSQSSKKSTVLPRTKCPDCGKEITKKGLERHRKEQHQSEELKCSLCPYTTKRAAYLSDHQRRKHLEPIDQGRPKKIEKRKRTRSPFRQNKFEKRHKSALTMIEMNVKINEQFKEKDTKRCEELSERVKALEEYKKKADLERSKFKTRITIIESKQGQQKMPKSNDIPALLRFLNLSQDCTKKDIDSTITLRLAENSPESVVSADIFGSNKMTKEKREELVIFYNEASVNLHQWRKKRKDLVEDSITIE